MRTVASLAFAPDGAWADDALARARAEAEVARLRAALARAEGELDTLRATARLVGEELHLPTLLALVAEQAARAVHAAEARLWLAEPGGAVLGARWSGAAGPGDASIRVVVGEALAGAVLLRRASARGPDAVAVPLLDHQRRVIGVLEACGRLQDDGRDGAARAFGDRDAVLLEVLARHAAAGVVRAQLYDRLREWGQSLEMLLAFNAAVERHRDPARLVRALVEHAAGFLAATGGRAGLLLPGADHRGEPEMVCDARLAGGGWIEEPATWPRGVGIPGFLVESEFPYIANDHATDPLGDRALAAAGVARVLAVPIRSAEPSAAGADAPRLVGFFELHRAADAPPFHWQDAAFLETLGNTAAVSIQNGQLLRALERSRAQLRALSADHLMRLERERRHIARELHDVAGQALIGIKLGLQAAARRLGDAPALGGELDALRVGVNDATLQLKRLARDLRPPTLDALGLALALRQLAGEVAARTGLAVSVHAHDDVPRLGHDAEIALYRIAQEALTNVARHAGATAAAIALAREGDVVVLEIVDDGAGFDPDVVPQGLGRLGMQERAELLHGAVTLVSAPGSGTTVRVEVPLGGAAAPSMRALAEASSATPGFVGVPAVEPA